MSSEQAAPETRGITTELLGTVDLGPEIEGMEGRQMRLRMVTMEPGGVYGPLHDHVDRPGIVWILVALAGLAGLITDSLGPERRINILAITTSEIKVTVLIAEEYTELAVRSLHTAYGLDAA